MRRTKKKNARKCVSKAPVKKPGHCDAMGRRLREERRRIEKLRKPRVLDAVFCCHPMMPLVQEHLRKWRRKHKLSHNGAWEVTGVRRSCIRKLEEGKPSGRIETLLWMCEGYRAWPSEFFAAVERDFRRQRRR